MKNEQGFTLIELMIVVIVVGILAAVAIPNFMSMREKAERGQCISNQRNIVQGATLYAFENGLGDASLNVGTMASNGFINDDLSECPLSTIADLDDYTITFVGGRVDDVSCDVYVVDHDWTHVPN